jgi:hypothetical protein
VEGAALRATTNPGAAKDRRCRSGGDLPPPGLRLPPSRDALRRTSRLADGGASTPPIRAPSPRRDTNAAFAAHESTRKTYIPDFHCYGKIIVEIKAVETLTKEHRGQLMNYLRLTGSKLGLLVNFAAYPKAAVEQWAN